MCKMPSFAEKLDQFIDDLKLSSLPYARQLAVLNDILIEVHSVIKGMELTHCTGDFKEESTIMATGAIAE